MSLAVIAALPMASLLLACGFLLLWLDRGQLQPLPWLLALAAWAAALPVGAQALADAGWWPRPWAAFRDPTAGSAARAAVVVAVALVAPLAAVVATRRAEGILDGAVLGLAGGAGLGVSLALIEGGARGASALAAGALGVLACGAGSATLGAGLGFSKLVPSAGRRAAVRVVTALMFAVELGALAFGALACRRVWPNAPVAGGAVVATAAAVALAGVLLAATAAERRILARQLGEEVALGVLAEWVVGIVPSYRRRMRKEWWPRRDERQEVVRLLTVLAFRKERLRGLSSEHARLFGLEVGRLRQRARALLALAPVGSDEPGPE
jgi:hypothetical protein